MPQGTVFPLEGNQLAPIGQDQIPALKNWIRIADRTFLVERIAYSNIQQHLQRLPQAARAPVRRNAPAQERPKALLAGARPQIQRPFPPPRREVAAVLPARPLQVAQVRLPRQGLVLDWVLLNSLTNATLTAGTTFYVSNKTVTFTGLTRLEACTVKFSTNVSLNRLYFNGPIDRATAPGFPMYLTGQDDNSIGEVLPNSTGNMGTNRYALYAMALLAPSNTYHLHNLRFRNCSYALTAGASGQTYTLSHSQISHANTAIYNLGLNVKSYLRNVLIHDALITGLWCGTTVTSALEHVTFHRVKDFRNGTNGTVAATNCLLICTTNHVAFTGDWANVVTNYDPSGVLNGSRVPLTQIVHPSGYWEKYAYDGYGRLTTTVAQIANSATNSADNVNRVTEQSYAAVPSSLDDISITPDQPRTITETLKGQEISRRYKIITNCWIKDIACPTPGATWSDSANLVTATARLVIDGFSQEITAVTNADGTVTLYDMDRTATEETNIITTPLVRTVTARNSASGA